MRGAALGLVVGAAVSASPASDSVESCESSVDGDAGAELRVRGFLAWADLCG